MPMYDYRCAKCNNAQQAFRSVDARDAAAPTCKECGSATKRIQFPQDTAKPEGRKNLPNVFRKV